MNNDNVITSGDVTKKTPKSFNELNKAELIAAASYFGTETEGTNAELKADLFENGVTWSMYAGAFLKEPVEKEEEVKTPVVDPVEEVLAEEDEVLTAEPVPQLQVQQKYLIKMTRANPYFEYGHYKFTSANPYAIMEARDAQRILENEEGFRQAFPAELEEFYS